MNQPRLCARSVEGYWCTRAFNHDGPCALWAARGGRTAGQQVVWQYERVIKDNCGYEVYHALLDATNRDAEAQKNTQLNPAECAALLKLVGHHVVGPDTQKVIEKLKNGAA